MSELAEVVLQGEDVACEFEIVEADYPNWFVEIITLDDVPAYEYPREVLDDIEDQLMSQVSDGNFL